MIDKRSFKKSTIFIDHTQNAECYRVIPNPFGLVITGAMAYGVPIVASNLDNQRDN